MAKIVLVHGVGNGFTQEAKQATTAILQGHTAAFFDYSAYLDTRTLGRSLARFFTWPVLSVMGIPDAANSGFKDEAGDVMAYLLSADTRATIRALLAAFVAMEKPTHLIGFSLGTCIAEHARSLIETIGEPAQPQFIGLGSPLWIPPMRKAIDYAPSLLPNTIYVQGVLDHVAGNGKAVGSSLFVETHCPRLGHDLLAYLTYITNKGFIR